MANLVTVEANTILNATSGQAVYVNPTTPLKCRLVSVIGSATAPGTPVSGGPGPYSDQTLTFGTAASAGSISNTVALTFSGMPAVTVVGVDEYDSAGTPIRRWWGLLSASKTTNSGDTFSIAIGSYTKTLS